MTYKIFKVNPIEVDAWIDNYMPSIRTWYPTSFTDNHFDYIVEVNKMGWFILGNNFLFDENDHFFLPEDNDVKLQDIKLDEALIPDDEKAKFLLTYTTPIDTLIYFYNNRGGC